MNVSVTTRAATYTTSILVAIAGLIWAMITFPAIFAVIFDWIGTLMRYGIVGGIIFTIWSGLFMLIKDSLKSRDEYLERQKEQRRAMCNQECNPIEDPRNDA